jgi:hypothetical protein
MNSNGPFRFGLAMLGGVLAILCCPASAAERTADPKELPSFPPVASQDALNTFQLRKGFRLELVAAEPLVIDPIAFSFDADGRVFVIEMKDYPNRGERLGQVKRLEDMDGDGRFDKAAVFAKGLRPRRFIVTGAEFSSVRYRT